MRIVSLSPAATETLVAIGLKSHIVAVDQFSNFPDEVKALPHLKDHQRVDIETVKSCKPDLIFTATVIQEPLAREFKEKGLPVFHQDPRSLDAVLTGIEQLGIVAGAEEQALLLTKSMREELQHLKAKAKLMPRKVRVYCEEWHNPPMVSGNWVPDILATAGVQSFPIKSGELSRAVTLEEVTRFDPEMIVISWCGAGKLAEKNILMQRDGWEDLRAVREGRVYVIDDSLLNRPGPRLIEGGQRIYSLAFEILH